MPFKKKWKNRFYVDIYRLAAQGLEDQDIAKAIGFTRTHFCHLKKHRPTIQYALNEARAKTSGGSVLKSYMEYVYDRMPENLQILWDKIKAVEEEPNAVARIEAMLQEGGQYARMHLFLTALASYNFNVTKALRAVNITRKKLNIWIEDEPEFATLIDQMREHKKDFAEEALYKLVRKGDSNAVIFVNKTLNKDRGYADKTTIEHTGKIEHAHEHKHLLDLDTLNLPLEVRRAILAAVRKQRGDEDVGVIEGAATAHIAYKKVNGKKQEEEGG